MKKPGLILLFIAVVFSCNKKCETGKSLDFYFLEEYITKPNSDEIISESVILSEEKAIIYEEIISYDAKEHEFTLSKSAMEQLNGEPLIHKRAFAAVIDHQIIYTGYFWALFSSSVCTYVNIDYLTNDQNIIKVKLGYPTEDFGSSTPDERNNEKIIDLLDCDGKLK